MHTLEKVHYKPIHSSRGPTYQQQWYNFGITQEIFFITTNGFNHCFLM